MIFDYYIEFNGVLLDYKYKYEVISITEKVTYSSELIRNIEMETLQKNGFFSVINTPKDTSKIYITDIGKFYDTLLRDSKVSIHTFVQEIKCEIRGRKLKEILDSEILKDES
jgi:hypothetical protein